MSLLAVARPSIEATSADCELHLVLDQGSQSLKTSMGHWVEPKLVQCNLVDLYQYSYSKKNFLTS